MKFDLSTIDITDFNIRDCTFAGDDCVWVFPKLEGVSWNVKNEVLRSSIWRKSDGELVSGGFKKFFNWEQCPDLHPAPDVLTSKIKCVEKIDGSCLIVTNYKDQLITRTRRALTSNLLNGDELDKVLKVKYPAVFDLSIVRPGFSYLYEWVTPSNKIVLNYTEPELYLTGIVNHENYSYVRQHLLDDLAKTTFNVKRPRYKSYKSLAHMLEDVSGLKDAEGDCIYYKNEQCIRKHKSEWYKTVHNFKSNMSLKTIVDLFLEYDRPDYNTFCEAVLNRFKYEGLVEARSLISQICDAYTETKAIIKGMQDFVNRINCLNTRKAKAEAIFSSYGKTNRADIVFLILDGKELGRDQYKKLLFQTLIAL
jgi:hypothetical protein